NGADYVLTAADKTEIANLVAPLAESMQGGTVTYEIPKEYYNADFFAFDRNNITDPNKTGIVVSIPTAIIELAEIKIDVARMETDIESGIFEDLPEEVYKLPIDEQIPIFEEHYKNYMTISQHPWCPKTIKPWIYYAIVLRNPTAPLQQFFRNDIDIRIRIKRDYTEEETIVVANPSFIQASEAMGANAFYPVIIAGENTDETTGFDIIEFAIMMIGNCPKYLSDSKYATADDTIEEVTFTFIPKNTFVEVDKNDESI
ncbi:MAG: hypothetical protein K2K71_04010, partial [Eubacterium sp.]|nr:hypothetical protein [Eubacterium sp.]